MKGRILLIEDEKDFRETITEYLTLKNYKVETCLDLVEAKRKIVNLEADLVICDVGLPGKTGLAFLSEILPEKTVPFIFLSAYAERTDIAKAIAIGANEYITKPVKLDFLGQKVAELIG